MKVSGQEIKNHEDEKLLGIKINWELKFKSCLDSVIKKASKMLNVLPREH